jgi:hypothetical protein
VEEYQVVGYDCFCCGFLALAPCWIGMRITWYHLFSVKTNLRMVEMQIIGSNDIIYSNLPCKVYLT